MKKLIGILMAATMLIACSKKGEVYHNDLTLIINGKEYKTSQVVPCDGCSAIWIVYPVDSTVVQPIVINYNEQQGKKSVNKTVVQIP